jgi:protein-S-isoprenylcysteine O-methyltransferase Ste14
MAGEREGPDVVVPPPLVYLAPLLGGLLLDRLAPLPALPRGLRRPLGLTALAAGVGLMGWFVSTMQGARTPIDVRKAPTRLVATGPFSYTRNPAYVAMASIYAGISLLVGARWSLLFLPAALVTIDRGVIAREERYLARRFGRDYGSYRGRVRRWI